MVTIAINIMSLSKAIRRAVGPRVVTIAINIMSLSKAIRQAVGPHVASSRTQLGEQVDHIGEAVGHTSARIRAQLGIHRHLAALDEQRGCVDAGGNGRREEVPLAPLVLGHLRRACNCLQMP